MGLEDIQACDYLEDAERFADMLNGGLFQGRRVIEAKQLQEVNKNLSYTQSRTGKKLERDNVKRMIDGVLYVTLVIENQHSIDYHMVMRNMLAESLEYHRQWKQMKKEHVQKGDLQSGHEFISGMKQGEKFAPVITLVVYYGEEPWNGATSLHELLDFGNFNKEIKQYVSDYHINVFDYHNCDDFSIFETKLGVVFEFLKYSKDKEKIRQLVATYEKERYTLDEETFDLIAKLTKSEELLHMKEDIRGKDGEFVMCKALEDIKNEGKIEGKAEGEECFAKLTKELLRDARADELLRATTDKSFRDKLYQEYAINK